MKASRMHEERTTPPTLVELVHDAAETSAWDTTLSELPPAVAHALRAIAAGERVPTLLGPEGVALLGQTLSGWGLPFGRTELWPVTRLAAPELVERLDLPLETAQRIAAVVNWPIGFEPEDIREFAALSEEETAQLMAYLAKTHGLYATGSRYAAP